MQERKARYLSLQPPAGIKPRFLITPVKDNFVLDSDGSEVALKPRLSKKISSMQSKKNREAKEMEEKTIRTAKSLPVEIPEEVHKIGAVRKRRRTKKRITKEGEGPKNVHNVFTHFPFDATCKVCLEAKIQRSQNI